MTKQDRLEFLRSTLFTISQMDTGCDDLDCEHDGCILITEAVMMATEALEMLEAEDNAMKGRK